MDKQESRKRLKFAGYGAALGLVLGGLAGWLIDNPIIFAGGGMVLGVAIGSAIDQRRKG